MGNDVCGTDMSQEMIKNSSEAPLLQSMINFAEWKSDSVLCYPGTVILWKCFTTYIRI